MLPPAASIVLEVINTPGALAVAEYKPAPCVPVYPPPKVILPPNDLRALPEFSTMPPAVPPAALALSEMLPNKVCTVVDAPSVTWPEPIRLIEAPDKVLVRLALSVILAP